MAKDVILGIDEVGRGPWSGPLVVGAVILGEECESLPEYQELKDSKKLSAKKRQKLSDFILEHSLATGLGWSSAEEIDHFGLGPALKLAARRATKQVLQQKVAFQTIIIDGTINLLAKTPLEDRATLLKEADNLVKEVSAASIIAKVARDSYMIKLADRYPHYGFDSNVGYGTAAHRQGLEIFGTCPEHRKSFRPIQKLIAGLDNQEGRNHPQTKTTTEIGREAELITAKYLKEQGHSIVVHNFRTKTCEIDLISAKADGIYFTEVKYSENTKHGSPLERINKQKQEQMQYAAKVFLSKYQEYSNLQPTLAVASVTGAAPKLEEWFILPE